ncbi:uncharacterized protein LOC123878845 [Maniola jurtina]|uniref:uncharacterized protein LOC123878845 n=1 Tax=Maniola jurtina TaxID=191418 RepID=UPI001E68DD88|nr:uncharacterized protein LOC123878845 [Maniola jurtina]XP_045782160.1 uncharacterized protein LOC123878845 [Maniola jurtina]XP_045782161.1 uncharacterized protein LOC123878845 [Maniola jurtina]XP_045782162.1 uncharacterized protein LOC123878845 [Maniola jurtina]XP_045782163.1 uncharacterized protein LOC123878845 [Maniola jurtina]XP_045782165.1 uncharacterized protein LOC123878845 [Maniola jurtina]XP_045782166.1 uncharacterized protein LOC123878845 [Maniola jurtina]XP_045782167.1 uncharacte
MVAMEDAVTSYESLKNNDKALLLLRGKYVNLKLIQNREANGFVHAIDPEGHSMILQEKHGEDYQMILVPGQAILNISVIDSIPSITPAKKSTPTTTNLELEARKRKLISWFKLNLLPVTEEGNNIVFRSVLILPPYDLRSIYSNNLIVTKQVRDIVEKMPEDFKES